MGKPTHQPYDPGFRARAVERYFAAGDSFRNTPPVGRARR